MPFDVTAHALAFESAKLIQHDPPSLPPRFDEDVAPTDAEPSRCTPCNHLRLSRRPRGRRIRGLVAYTHFLRDEGWQHTRTRFELGTRDRPPADRRPRSRACEEHAVEAGVCATAGKAALGLLRKSSPAFVRSALPH